MAPPRKRLKTSKDTVSGLATPESEEDLEQTRRKNEKKLQSRFVAIYAKFGRDFTGISDEIDNRTGAIVVDNGHLRNMRNERDIGDRHRRAEPSSHEANEDDVDDELACDENGGGQEDDSSASESGSERDAPFDSIWSDPNILDKTQTSASETLASEVVQAAVPSMQDCDVSDPSFATTFSMNLMRQVMQVMQTFQAQQMRQITAGPVVRSGMKQPSKRTQTMRASALNPPSASRVIGNSAQLKAVSRNSCDHVEVNTTSITEDHVTSELIAAKPMPTSRARGRDHGYTIEEDETIMALSAQKQIDWQQLKSCLPHRTAHALRNRVFKLRRISGPVDRRKPEQSDDVSMSADQLESASESCSVWQPEDIQFLPASASVAHETPANTTENHTACLNDRQSIFGSGASKKGGSWRVKEDERLLRPRQETGFSQERVARMMPHRTRRACEARFAILQGTRLSTQGSTEPESSVEDLSLSTGPEAGDEVEAIDLGASVHDEPMDEQQTTTPNEQLYSEMHAVPPLKTSVPLYDAQIELIHERTRYQRRSRNDTKRQNALDKPADLANETIDPSCRPHGAEQDAKHMQKAHVKKPQGIRPRFTAEEDKMLLALEHKWLPFDAYNGIASVTGRSRTVLRNRHLLLQKLGQALDHHDGPSKKDIRNTKIGHGNAATRSLPSQDGFVDVIPPGYVIEILDSEDEGEVVTGNQVEPPSKGDNTTHMAVVLETHVADASHPEEFKDYDNSAMDDLRTPSPAPVSAPVMQSTRSTNNELVQDDDDELGQDSVDLTSSYTMSSSSTALIRRQAGSSPLAQVNERTARLKGGRKDSHRPMYRHSGSRLLTPVSSSSGEKSRSRVMPSHSESASGKLKNVRRRACRMIMPAMRVDDDGSEDELA